MAAYSLSLFLLVSYTYFSFSFLVFFAHSHFSFQLISESVSFHNHIADSWSARYKSRGFSRRLDFFRRLFSFYCNHDSLWLDAGCGSGVLSRELVSFGAKVKGIDASRPMISLAIAESSSIKNRLSFECVDGLYDIAYASSSLDGILCSSVLEYISSPIRALSEFSRILSPNGVLILSIPNYSSFLRSFQFLLRDFLAFFGVNVFPYLSVSCHAFTRDDISLLLDRTGFNLVSLDYYDPFVPSSLFSVVSPSLIVLVATKD